MDGYKTLIISLVSVLAGVATMSGHGFSAEQLQSLTNNLEALVGGVIAVMGAVMGVLRFISTTPVAKGKFAEWLYKVTGGDPAVLAAGKAPAVAPPTTPYPLTDPAAAVKPAGGFVRLSMLPWLFAMAFVALLVGCGTQFTIHPSAQENVTKDPKVATQNLIDEANAGLTAAYTTVLSGKQSGAMTHDEALAYKVDLDKASDYIDGASAFLGSGDITSAQGQINLANSIIAIVQSKLIAIKQKGQ